VCRLAWKTFSFSWISIVLAGLGVGACDGSDDNHSLDSASTKADASASTGHAHSGSELDAGPPSEAAGSSATFKEKPLTVALALAITVDPGAGAFVDSDAGEPAKLAKLTITARDGSTPVLTDLWLYTLENPAKPTPLSGFTTATTNRKTARRMLPLHAVRSIRVRSCRASTARSW
jgi:hypothetical protein